MPFFRRLFHKRENGPCPPGTPQGKWRLAVFFGVLVALLAGYLATAGVVWSLHFHPDEGTVTRWIDQTLDDGYITDRAYPSGWFELYRIKARLEKNADKISQNWQRHAFQDGRVDTVSKSSYVVRPTDSGRNRHTDQDGRDFNAWLYVLTALFLYVACLEAGLHPLSAFVSALFFLASAAPIEFIRYCETDAGLLVSMAFFAWLSARALRKKSVWLAVAAGFAAGFAVACKFSLVPLLLWAVAAPAAVCRIRGVPPSRWVPRCIALALAALLAAAAGYVAGTPAIRLAPEWYFDALRRASEGTYNEICANLAGPYAWWPATVLRAQSFAANFAQLGLLSVLWAVFAWTFWFRKPFRRQALGLPMLLPLFGPFLVAMSPFVRRQELLPFSILFALGAGLPLEWLVFRRAERSPLSRAGRIAVVLIVLLGAGAFADGLAHAFGMASCFTSRDTRAEAQNWLRDFLPARTPVAFDSYVGQAARGVDCQATQLNGLPFLWDGIPRGRDESLAPRYYVENVGFQGRLPIRDTKTGAIRPEVLRRLNAYNASVLPVRTWSVSRFLLLPTFVQPVVRLVSFEQPAPDAFDVPVGYARPVLLLADGARLYDAAGLPGLGAFRAVHTVGKRSLVHLKLEDGSRWLVTRMLWGGDPVRIAREGLFKPERAELPVGGAVAAALRPGLGERLLARAAAYSTGKCRMFGDDQAIVCASYLTSTPAETARELRLAGNPAGALEILEKAGPLDAAAQVEAFLASSEAHILPSGEWTEAARKALEACNRLAEARDSLGRTGATLCGVPVGIAEDFARLRTGRHVFAPGVSLPAHLPPGRYALAVTVRVEDFPRNLVLPSRLFAQQTEDFAVEEVDGRWILTSALDVDKPQLLELLGADDDSLFAPFVAEAEIAWSPVERTLAAAEPLRRALASSSPSRAGSEKGSTK